MQVSNAKRVCIHTCCKTDKFLWKNVFVKIYFRSKNLKILGLQVEQSTHIMFWKSMWDLGHQDVLFCVGNATATCYLFRQLKWKYWTFKQSLLVRQLWANTAVADIPQNKCSYKFLKNSQGNICAEVSF